MKIRVLGSYGARLPGFGTSCFLVDDRLLLDAGSVVWKLSLEEQVRVDDVLVTHAHLDHMVDLAFFADNVFAFRADPVRIWAPEEVIAALRRYLFNGVVWPDFTRLPSPERPAIVFQVLSPGQSVDIAGLRVSWAQTRHPVFAAGYLLEQGGEGVLFSGDTGPTEEIWRLGRTCATLKGVFAEASFPNARRELALASGHLTPELLAAELDKLGRPEAEVKIYHMKPQYLDEVMRDIAAVGRDLQVLHGDELFRY